MALMTPEELEEFFAAPLVAHLTTLRADGSPHTAPVWYDYRDGRFLVFTWDKAVKVANLERDPERRSRLRPTTSRTATSWPTAPRSWRRRECSIRLAL